MYASIRQYQSTDAAEVGRQTQEGFVPIVREIAGFSAYYVVNGGDGSVTTVTVAGDEAAVEESVAKAHDWVAENVADLIQGEPKVIVGEVVAQS
jgi:hypothetical protein